MNVIQIHPSTISTISASMEHPRSLRLSLFRLPSITMLPFRNILLPPSLPHVPASDRFIGNLWPFPSAAFPPLTPCLLSTYLPSCLHSSLTICLPPKIPYSVIPSLLLSLPPYLHPCHTFLHQPPLCNPWLWSPSASLAASLT